MDMRDLNTTTNVSQNRWIMDSRKMRVRIDTTETERRERYCA